MADEKDNASHLEVMIEEHKGGKNIGIFSVCSAHPTVLESCLQEAARREQPLLIESTCNQVNQEGGYMNLTPSQFVNNLHTLAYANKLPQSRLILGGDHLGPYPWRKEPAKIAMEKARALVEAYVKAGYAKIHLDASASCADEGGDRPLDPRIIAARTAELCQAGELTHQRFPEITQAPVYVIGTDVPPPGGSQENAGKVHITAPEDALQTIEFTRREFMHRGLDSAWERVIAVVVQPGVEFGDQVVHRYDSIKASALSQLIKQFDKLVYEAHSTDYQTTGALRQMVEDHFAILKVGPALTFAFREAVFALSFLEKEWLGRQTSIQLSHLPEVLERVMLADPWAWEGYYQEEQSALHLALGYSYSDRCRYYWTHPEVRSALARLFENLSSFKIPPTLVSEFLPQQYQLNRDGYLDYEPHNWVRHKIASALYPYFRACMGEKS